MSQSRLSRAAYRPSKNANPEIARVLTEAVLAHRRSFDPHRWNELQEPPRLPTPKDEVHLDPHRLRTLRRQGVA